jgi:hypothetical protein
MIQEKFYKVVVTKVTKGIKEQRSWEKIYDDKHPKVLANPETSQYAYVDVVKPFSDTETLLEQKLDDVDLNKILRALNKDL